MPASQHLPWTLPSYQPLGHSRIAATIVCKLEPHKSGTNRGYIAMLVVEKAYRGLGVGSELVKRAVKQMKEEGADEVVLEAEVRTVVANYKPSWTQHALRQHHSISW